MMSAFFEHPYKQGLTYFLHLVFATGIAWRLLCSVLAFSLHAVLPFISIKPRFDLEATSAFLLERNHYVETAAATAHGLANRGRAHSNPSHITHLQ
jgi:hypothetical protein